MIGFFFLLSLPLFGQYTFTTPTISLADNTPFCATISCLTSIGGTTAETKAGFDGTIYGLTGSGFGSGGLFRYTVASGWVQAPAALQTAGGYPLIHISVGSASQVLALSAAAYPHNNVYVLNSAGTARQPLSQSGWLSLAEIGPDGSVWGINLNLSSIYSFNGASWTTEPGVLDNLAVGSPA
jgi:hypothetical protein